MNRQQKESVEKTIELIKRCEKEKNLTNYSPYKSVYLWTNEDIKNTLKMIPITQKEKALTVLSSGDHPFNLLVDGYQEIDTFDVNELSEYTSLGLKRALILKHPKKEFENIMDYITTNKYTKEEELDLIRDCFNEMELEHKLFFQELLDAVARKEILTEHNNRLLDHLVKKNRTITTDKVLGNNYLSHNKNYEILQQKLKTNNIRFYPRNILKLEKRNNNYDLIHLSNILDYADIEWGSRWKLRELRKLENHIKHELSDDGIIILSYIFQYFDSVDYYFNNEMIKRKRCKREKLIPFKNAYEDNCAILIKKK